MAIKPPAGPKQDFYLANGSKDFAIFPAGLVPEIPNPIPIRLQRGNKEYGAIHIVSRHGHWLDKYGLDVAAMVWLKLQQNGMVFSSEENNKLKINMRLAPNALLILRYIFRPEPFLSVTSIYFKGDKLDGQQLGLYEGLGLNEFPIFSLKDSTPTISVKKKRVIELPA